MKTRIFFFILLLFASMGATAQQTTLTFTASQLPYTLGSTANAQGGTGLQYKWYKNGVEIGGATSATYPIPVADYVEGTMTITYTRAAKCNECTSWLFANPIAVTICAPAALPTVSLNYACAAGAEQTATFTATGGNNANQYAWSTNNGVSYGSFAATTTATAALGTSQAEIRFVKAKNTGNGCVSIPASVKASLPTRPNITYTCAAATPQSATFTVSGSVGGSGTLSYQWGTATTSVGGTWTATGTSPRALTTSSASFYGITQDAKGCRSNVSAPLTASLPGTPTAADYSCANNQTATFTGSGSTDAGTTGGSITYRWGTTNDVVNGTWNTGTVSIAGVTTATNYYMLAQNAKGCRSATRAVSVGLPSITATSSNLGTAFEFCASSGSAPITLSATVATASSQTVDWYSASSGGTFLAAGANTTAATYIYVVPQTLLTDRYYAQARDFMTNCILPTRTLVATAIPSPPKITGNILGTTGSVSLSASVSCPSVGVTVDWYDTATGGNLLLSGNTSYTATVPFTVYAESRITATGAVSSMRTQVGSLSGVFEYTGSMQSVSLAAGTYKLEVWGAAGGRGDIAAAGVNSTGGLGGYATGTITIPSTTVLYIYVGGKGEDALTVNNIVVQGGWNGGAPSGMKTNTGTTGTSGGGGGASDIRIGATSLNHRVIVAGGGGGGGSTNNSGQRAGGTGGGTNGGNGLTYSGTAATGGTQTDGGKAGQRISGDAGLEYAANGVFGVGGNGETGYSNSGGAGGGGGWYGGGGGSFGSSQSGSAGGGSGYVLTSTSHRPNGYIHAVGSPYQMTNNSMQDGIRTGNGRIVITKL